MHYLKRLLPFLKPYRGSLVLLALWTIGGIVAGTLQPYQLSLVVDQGIAKMDMQAVTRYCLMLIGLTALYSLFNYLQGVQHGTLGANVVRDLRNTLYQKLQRLPFSWYTRTPTGQIMSRMLGDLDSVEQFVSFGFVLMIREAVTLSLTLAICIYLDWQLTLLVMLPAPFLLYSITRFRKRIDPAWEAIREQMGKLTSVVQENVAGVRVVKAFAREGFAMQRFGAENDVNRQKNVGRAKLEADYFPSADFFSSLSFVILVLVGSFRLMDGTLSYGTFFSFTWYIWSLIWPMRELGFFTNIMRQAAASAPRLFAIADAEEMVDGEIRRGGDDGMRRVGDEESDKVSSSHHPLIPSTPHPIISSSSAQGRIEFDQVRFAFPDDLNTPVLNGVSFAVEPGQTVAILGGTGSGKSSIINLLPRFYDVTGGRVLVDGVDVRDMPLKDLRLKMSLVPQETFLFSASLKDNVAFGKPDASLDEVVAASKVAQVDEFAQKLPKAYETKVGERGVGLSGGQKQRVALARAVLMNPAILILDEATSAVDTATEAVIQDAMAQVMRGRTSLVVAQRLSTVRNADKIIVLAEGRVVQEGSHEQLYAVAGPYRELYDLQFKDQETAHADELDDEVILEEETEDGRQKTGEMLAEAMI